MKNTLSLQANPHPMLSIFTKSFWTSSFLKPKTQPAPAALPKASPSVARNATDEDMLRILKGLYNNAYNRGANESPYRAANRDAAIRYTLQKLKSLPPAEEL